MRLKHYFVIILILSGFTSCEKDDICVDNDSAYVSITFYSAENPETAKSVSNFSLKELTGSVIGSFENTTVASIALLLPADTNQYTVVFEQQIIDDQNSKTLRDTLVFSYTPKVTFTSRACGFTRSYEDLSVSLQGTPNWIQEIRVLQSSITNTSDEHVAIYH